MPVVSSRNNFFRGWTLHPAAELPADSKLLCLPGGYCSFKERGGHLRPGRRIWKLKKKSDWIHIKFSRQGYTFHKDEGVLAKQEDMVMKTYNGGSVKWVLMLAGVLALPALFPAGVLALAAKSGPVKKAEIAETKGAAEKEAVEVKEAKEVKGVKEAKPAKEQKEAKGAKEPKEAKELKAPKEAKEAKEVKEIAGKDSIDEEKGGELDKDPAGGKEAAGQKEIDENDEKDTELDKDAAGEKELDEDMADEKETAEIENDHEDAMESEVDDKGDEVEKDEPEIVEAGD